MAAPRAPTFWSNALFCALFFASIATSGCPREREAPPRAAVPAHDAAAANAVVAKPPPPPPPSPVQQGGELYGRMCAVCHGAEGEGYKADHAPALAHPAFLASVSDEFLRFAIEVGRPGTTMSAWSKTHGGPLSERDVLAVVSFLRSWQKQPKAELDESPVRGNVKRGEAGFEKSCLRCHGNDAPNLHLLQRELLAYARPGFLRHAIRHGRPGTEMEGFEQSLGKQAIEDIVAYLRSLPAHVTPEDLAGTVDPPPLPLGPVPLNPRGREPKGFRAHPEMTSVDVVAPELAKKARMALLDARTPSDYMQGHIQGAVSVPFYDPSPYLAELPKDAWLVCYCGCPHAESGSLAAKLTEAGFKKVTILDEGLGYWQTKGYPMQKGPSP